MNILITGANRGIGKALFDGYAAQGQNIIGTHRQADAGAMRELDVTDPAAHARLAEALEGTALDLLICNAGIYPDKGQTLDHGYSAAMWAEGFATNVTGVFLTIQHLLPHLRAAQDARIAIISSQMASHTRAPGGSYIYRASKAAVLNLGRNLATDLRPEGISVGIYHPGWVQTDMGGATAEIDVDTARRGLMDRFAALSIETTGCFETWDGQAHAY
ncbi:SDR family NAD(P)-dependent oxidoreductase [Cognatiyoonia sp. IB215446]|uniref:SDR family NAD(P)-dependent oxidoreductase n=1 Tax=Cognatiyoonia sp. IB215446 TaxID=3097355 RepID=UPI002A0C6755|nr:SDR family NAD(P)-dependent oxidoreductase [Cognatiyoonia sp. IB215446]MDX8347307.1 SDR family NAD(P)-dependent oxidoreductase [Cognatiyoonia sp. IB215446]